MRLLEHVVEAGVIQLGVEAELFGVAREERLAGIGDADDLYIRTMQVVLEEAFDVTVHKSDDGDAKGNGAGLGGG